MPVTVRDFRRTDREQLTALVNLHAGAVVPGVAVSTNVVLAQLEREPGELVLDPWVAERRCLVATESDVIVAATLVHRYRDDEDVRPGYRAAAEVRWLIARPGSIEAGGAVLDAAIDLATRWGPTRLWLDGSLPAPGCYGVPSVWPHVRQLVIDAGFDGPSRSELVLAADCATLLTDAAGIEGTTAVRSVGALGTRIDLVADGESLGYVEVGEIDARLSRSATSVSWTDVGNLFPADPGRLADVMPALYRAAAEWLLLGGVDRLIDYYAADVDRPEYLAVMHRLGFSLLTTNERGWERRG